MKNFPVKLILFSLVIVLITSCASNLYNEPKVLDKDKTMYKDSDLGTIKKYDSLFSIVDYFSSSYFYSEEQIKEFFNVDFIVERTKSSAFHEIFLFPSSDNSETNIEKMEIRSNRSGQQLLILKFKTPLCFGIDSFLYRMKHDDYTWVSNNNQFSFSKVMDEVKNIGTVELFFNSLGDSENQQICVSNLLFDTFEVFDKVKYEQAFREQNNDLH